MVLHVAPLAVVVIAGLPGAGKSTLIRRLAGTGVRVIDTDDARARGEGGRGLVVRHYLAIARAVREPRAVVVHTRGTRRLSRLTIRLLAAAARRPAVLLLLDTPRAVAEAGQRDRGRVIPARAMDREARRWRRLLARGVRGERWHEVHVLDRARAPTALSVAPNA